MVQNYSFFVQDLFSKYYFLNGNHLWPTYIVCKNCFSFKLKYRKIATETVVKRTSTTDQTAPDQLTIPFNKLPWFGTVFENFQCIFLPIWFCLDLHNFKRWVNIRRYSHFNWVDIQLGSPIWPFEFSRFATYFERQTGYLLIRVWWVLHIRSISWNQSSKSITLSTYPGWHATKVSNGRKIERLSSKPLLKIRTINKAGLVWHWSQFTFGLSHIFSGI